MALIVRPILADRAARRSISRATRGTSRACHAQATVGSAAGHDLPYASHVTFTITGTYALTVVPGNEFDLNVAINHVGGFFLEPDNVMQQPGYTKLNTSIEWRPAQRHYSVLLWGRNLTNEAVFSYGGTLVNGLHTVSYEPPRTYGVTFRYDYR